MPTRDDHGHFSKPEDKHEAKLSDLSPKTPKAGGWKYHGAVRDTASPDLFVHRWTIDDPTGAPLVFTVRAPGEHLSEADAIKVHKERMAG